MAELNVNPADVVRAAESYSELAARAAMISPQAAVEVQRIAEAHGPMGYPTAVGITAGLANAEGRSRRKSPTSPRTRSDSPNTPAPTPPLTPKTQPATKPSTRNCPTHTSIPGPRPRLPTHAFWGLRATNQK
ncbi:MAG TPA: hypothetical protein VE197_22175 [Mycobacterium sp.]|nr:hypothetical protein [Mycobacterium sp.]